jgi:hypothetical protein
VNEVGRVRDLVAEHFGPWATVSYHLNRGGFVNHSFAVDRDGEALWVKVAGDEEDGGGLARWARLGGLLAERYGAPPVLEAVRIGGCVALVFPRLGHPRATQSDFIARVDQLLDLLGALHCDADLADELAGTTSPTTGEAFREVWHRRLSEDLARLAESPVPFVDDQLVTWMAAETAALGAATNSAAFAGLATSPVHGDLWTENVLGAPDRLWVLDWDDLSLGDPLLDESIVLFNAYGADIGSWQAVRPPREAAEAARFAVAARAQQLDLVIDSLADWVEAAKATEHREAVRDGKEQVHRLALQLYREQYADDEPWVAGEAR